MPPKQDIDKIVAPPIYEVFNDNESLGVFKTLTDVHDTAYNSARQWLRSKHFEDISGGFIAKGDFWREHVDDQGLATFIISRETWKTVVWVQRQGDEVKPRWSGKSVYVTMLLDYCGDDYDQNPIGHDILGIYDSRVGK
ncbi:hypothetical protein K440DRAFT_645573 [Wilcoxina mikolae CBS 423.85]|nr:hypothetical protein K440DRAFT_645573 [Wilcoxina mikolae CBS 423.85]